VGRLVVWVTPYVVGPAVEYGVRFAEERGPELAGKGAAIAKDKAPAAAAAVREKAPVVALAAKDALLHAAERMRERRPK
jgi:hypothetical protein